MGLARRRRAVGVLVGHTEGLTHLDSKVGAPPGKGRCCRRCCCCRRRRRRGCGVGGRQWIVAAEAQRRTARRRFLCTLAAAQGDGRYLISNAKDQTIKLWDTRKAAALAEHDRRPRNDYPRFNWDYRWDAFPARGRLIQHPRDGSLATFRGHSVVHTLIRAYWSPAESTGQRYIYAGSADGTVRIWGADRGRGRGAVKAGEKGCREGARPLLGAAGKGGSSPAGWRISRRACACRRVPRHRAELQHHACLPAKTPHLQMF